MKAEDIKRVLIAGAGTMGQSIGTSCVTHGFAVVLYDVKDEIPQKGEGEHGVEDRQNGGERSHHERGRRTMKNNITTTTDIAVAGADADLVSESIPEDPKH